MTLQFRFLEPKIYSRRFSGYGGDQCKNLAADLAKFVALDLKNGSIKIRSDHENYWPCFLVFPGVLSGKVFASQERVSCFPEKGLTSGEVRETSGEVRETSGEVRETSGEPLDCCKVPQ